MDGALCFARPIIPCRKPAQFDFTTYLVGVDALIGPYKFYRTFPTSIRRKSRARLWSMESPENHPKGSLVVSFLFLLEPKGDPAQRSAFGKEEGGCEYGAFAAPAEAEWSRLLLTLRRFFSFSEKRKKRMGRKKRRWASAHLSISLLFALQVTPIISQRYLAGARRRRRTRRLCRGRSARR